MSEQLAEWTGDFGRAYLERNKVNPATRVDWFRKTLRPLRLKSVCEIGANRAHNLVAIERALGQKVITFGVEPSADARAAAHDIAMREGDIFNVPFVDRGFDLAFTSGVLIHVAPENLDAALREMHRVAGRFLLAIEYADTEDVEVEYRGMPNMLWRRDYGAHYLRLFPELRVRECGAMTEADGFAPGDSYWLLEKTSAGQRAHESHTRVARADSNTKGEA